MGIQDRGNWEWCGEGVQNGSNVFTLLGYVSLIKNKKQMRQYFSICRVWQSFHKYILVQKKYEIIYLEYHCLRANV